MPNRFTGCRASLLSGCLLLAACAPARDTRPAFGSPEAWLTTSDRRQLLAPLAVDTSGLASPVGAVISLDTAATFQAMTGFGAALTDASVAVLQHLAPDARDRVLRDLMSPDDGIGLSFVRITIGASDFSPVPYTLDDMPDGQTDSALAHFSIAPDQVARLPILRRMRALNPGLRVMATPWSAPAWMKSSGTLAGGTLRDDAMPVYAEYLRRVLDAYAADSVPVDFLSVQNEPQHEPADYPGMRLTSAQRAAFVGRHLGPLLATRGSHTALLEWDHNWDAPESPLAVMEDSVARRYLRGVAWHCYAGDVSAQSVVHDRFPGMATYFTECSGGAWAPNWGDNLLWNMRTLVIGTTRHWASGVLLWNLALDEHHGPHRGGCADCRGVLTVDSAGVVTRNEEYYVLAHASRFVRPGAVRIGSSSASVVDHVAFRHLDDGSVVLIAANPTTDTVAAVVYGLGSTSRLVLPARSVVTVRWPGRARRTK